MNRSPLAPVPGWPEAFVQRYRERGYWQAETLDAFLTARAARFPERTALVGAPAAARKHNLRLSYAQLHAAAGRAAAELAGRGIGGGDRVIVQLPNCVEFALVIFGLWRLGTLPVFALPAHRHREIEQFARITDASAHIVAGSAWGFDYAGLASEVAGELAGRGHAPPEMIDVERWAWGAHPDGYLDEGVEPALVEGRPAEQVAFLQLSGGTTGVPKLIPRTHADYLYSVRESATICGVTENTVMLTVLAAAHNFPMSSPGMLGVFDRGGTVVLAPDPSPRTAFSLIEAERVTMSSLVPPLAQAWLASGARVRFDLSSLETIQVGGSRLADAVARRVRPELGAQLQQVFGMAEGLVNYTGLDDPEELVMTTQGRPISPDDEILVVDEADRPVPDGEEGQLLTRGPYTIRGYYRAEAHNLTAFTEDGFYRTGDLVVRLPTGHLRVTGRVKDQINRAGEKISAEEVEGVLLQHPQVSDVAIVAAEDDALGERLHAFVIATPGTPDQELREFLRSRGLATFKVPDRFSFVDTFPTTGVGKISRRELRRLLRESLSTEENRS